ncbi:MAG: hypothetical protein AAGI08_05275, partial [Bacteroidota bacterium]
MEQRTFPYGTWDRASFADELEQAVLRTPGKQNLQWTFLGPENIGGRMTDVAYALSEPDVAYAAAA